MACWLFRLRTTRTARTLSRLVPLLPRSCRRLNEHLQFIIMTPIRFRIVAIAICSARYRIKRWWWWWWCLELRRYLIVMFQHEMITRVRWFSVFYGLTRRMHIRAEVMGLPEMTIFIMPGIIRLLLSGQQPKCALCRLMSYCGIRKTSGTKNWDGDEMLSRWRWQRHSKRWWKMQQFGWKLSTKLQNFGSA